VNEEMFGQYRLEELLGVGGMGEVYRAYDTVRGRVVAIKRLPEHMAADEVFKARFRSESALVARLREPHIIPIHDFGEIDGRLYIDMRLVDGPNFAALLAQQGPIAPESAVNLVAQIAAALDVAHAENLVHRDIKPSNVLISGSAEFAYLADFGIARLLGESEVVTAAGATVGSVHYMAPERFTGGEIDHRVDVYSLGCLLFEALTARKPFTAEGMIPMLHAHLNAPPPRPSELVPGLPVAMDDVVARAMAKDPADRYSSAGELAAAAREALVPEPVVVMVPPPTPYMPAGQHRRGGTPIRPRRGLIITAVLATAFAMLGSTTAALSLESRSARIAPVDVRMEARGMPGENPFMPPVGKDRADVKPPTGAGGKFTGGTAGLYGGTENVSVCDAAAMIAFLRANPDKQAAWASVVGIAPETVPDYVAALTAVTLRTDTAVTNHGYAGGKATVIPSVLQAGTAVLIDNYGVPRVRCFCGNPLTPAPPIEQSRYVGAAWSGFQPAAVTKIEPAPAPIEKFVLVDPSTKDVFSRETGTDGEKDKQVDPETIKALQAPADPSTPGSQAQSLLPSESDKNESHVSGATEPTTTNGPELTLVPRSAGTSTPPTPTPGKVDLAAGAIQFAKADLVVGKAVAFSAAISNAGTEASGPFAVRWAVDGKDVNAGGRHTAVAAGAGDSAQMSQTFNAAGKHTVTFAVDTGNSVAESNEGNNQVTASFEVTVAPAKTEGAVDTKKPAGTTPPTTTPPPVVKPPSTTNPPVTTNPPAVNNGTTKSGTSSPGGTAQVGGTTTQPKPAPTTTPPPPKPVLR
jgi:hypothetical protein